MDGKHPSMPKPAAHCLIMYYFDKMTPEAIDEAENCTYQAVRDSIKNDCKNWRCKTVSFRVSPEEGDRLEFTLS